LRIDSRFMRSGTEELGDARLVPDLTDFEHSRFC
jgi:hypothetical protein